MHDYFDNIRDGIAARDELIEQLATRCLQWQEATTEWKAAAEIAQTTFVTFRDDALSAIGEWSLSHQRLMHEVFCRGKEMEKAMDVLNRHGLTLDD